MLATGEGQIAWYLWLSSYPLAVHAAPNLTLNAGQNDACHASNCLDKGFNVLLSLQHGTMCGFLGVESRMWPTLQQVLQEVGEAEVCRTVANKTGGYTATWSAGLQTDYPAEMEYGRSAALCILFITMRRSLLF
jgi:hypothetical protein